MARIVFLVSALAVAVSASCQSEHQALILAVASLGLGITIAWRLRSVEPNDSMRELNANVAEAQEIVSRSLKWRVLGDQRSIGPPPSLPGIVEVPTSPLSYLLLSSIGAMLFLAPDTSAIPPSWNCSLEPWKLKSAGLRLGQLLCFALSIVGLALAFIPAKAK